MFEDLFPIYSLQCALLWQVFVLDVVDMVNVDEPTSRGLNQKDFFEILTLELPCLAYLLRSSIAMAPCLIIACNETYTSTQCPCQYYHAYVLHPVDGATQINNICVGNNWMLAFSSPYVQIQAKQRNIYVQALLRLGRQVPRMKANGHALLTI